MFSITIKISNYFWLRYYSSLEVAAEYFRSGADKISIGSDAVYAAEEFVKSGVSLYMPSHFVEDANPLVFL